MDTANENKIHGVVERITFHSEESGFCVLRVKVKNRKDLIALTGHLATISVGETIEARGSWINDKKHGLQFKAQQLTLVPPSTLEGIEKYLASGMIKGIGPHFAKKMINKFGESIFDIIEKSPEKLKEIKGLGKIRKGMIIDSWKEQQAIKHIMVFLQSHGIHTARAVRIYKIYGQDAISKVQANPYQLAQDIHGIGFKTADEIAIKLGIAKDSLIRAQAGVKYVLQTLCKQGHCAAYYDQLIESSIELLSIEESEIIKQAIANELEVKNLISENINEKLCIFPVTLYQSEHAVAKHLIKLATYPFAWQPIDREAAIRWVEKKTNIELSTSQKNAIDTVLKNKLSIITGGPGVGKTTIVNSILKILQAQKLSVALCAPTGRAAKRLTETTGMLSKTIHRLLEFDPKTRAFKHQQHNPLPIDVLIVDEASMIDIVLMHHLLKAIPAHVSMVFVGDVDQLPSVGPGNVLLNMIQSNIITTVKLTEIFRQAKNSNIVVNAHRINQGFFPLQNTPELSDFYTIYADNPDEIHDQVVSLMADRLPRFFNCNPRLDVQLLTPMNRGGLGTHALNIVLQKVLNAHSEPKVIRFGITYAVGDKVIQTINNYDKEVFNGDIGLITTINLNENTLNVLFDHKHVTYQFNELDELNLAYAISIHKSQGSEFPIVVIPIATQHFPLLMRNLLYTAVTRGKKLVVLVSQKKALGIALNSQEESKRLTRLAERLKELGELSMVSTQGK